MQFGRPILSKLQTGLKSIYLEDKAWQHPKGTAEVSAVEYN